MRRLGTLPLQSHMKPHTANERPRPFLSLSFVLNIEYILMIYICVPEGIHYRLTGRRSGR
jgi:hypothetical protein